MFHTYFIPVNAGRSSPPRSGKGLKWSWDCLGLDRCYSDLHTEVQFSLHQCYTWCCWTHQDSHPSWHPSSPVPRGTLPFCWIILTHSTKSFLKAKQAEFHFCVHWLCLSLWPGPSMIAWSGLELGRTPCPQRGWPIALHWINDTVSDCSGAGSAEQFLSSRDQEQSCEKQEDSPGSCQLLVQDGGRQCCPDQEICPPPQILWEAVPALCTASLGREETPHNRNEGCVRRWSMKKKEKAKSMCRISFKAGLSHLQHCHGCTSWMSTVTERCENALNKLLSPSCCVCEHPHCIRQCWVALLLEKR